jgi:predicted RNA-binding Zn-ribbon protein involved in translation (DUF1610 family)
MEATMKTQNKYCTRCSMTTKQIVNDDGSYTCPKCGTVATPIKNVNRTMIGSPWSFRTGFEY